MKWILFLSLVACNYSTTEPERGTPAPVPVETAKPAEVNAPALGKPYLTVTSCSNCSDEQYARIQASAKKTNEVITTKCFRDFMENRKLIQTNNRTPAQVVDYLVSGGVKIETEMYWTIKRVLGYTLPDANKEWLNSRYMMSWSVCDLASLLGHESSHKLGFDHDFYDSPSRQYSIPYSINAAFEKCCE